MGIAEILTIIFIVLKLTHEVSWSWPIVMLPEIISVGLYILMWTLAIIFGVKMIRS